MWPLVPDLTWGQVPIGDLIGAPIGGPGRITGKREGRDLRDGRDESENRRHALSAVTFLANLTLLARLAYSPPRRPDDPCYTIIAPTKVEILLIVGQCFRQVFSMQFVEDS